ncbi:mitochondrial amidoxime-reducing component 1-like [Odontomachus brunneus]|uniref:mitochondrial amidoxime-reducing component 1-like n=1 Tax=Odontomachus brunneus TaxID=486640 RepID=UPI0013F2A20C|nr:mitochondrial amidoxime-reducing component 1-like [Odontomachus brunneus]
MIGQVWIAFVCITTVCVVVKQVHDKDFSKKKFHLIWPISKETLKKLYKKKKWRKVGTVDTIFVYPLLSIENRIMVQKLNYNEHLSVIDNFIYRDNMFVVYNTNTKDVQTDKQLRLVNIKIKNQFIVQLSAPNMSLLDIDLREITKKINIIECMNPAEEFLPKIKFTDCGDEAAAWLSMYLNKTDIGLGCIIQSPLLRKIFWPYMKELCDSYICNINDKNIEMPQNILPECRLLILSSLQRFNEITSHDTSNVQFNPNIVIDLTKPLEEVEWDWIRIGEVTLKNVKPWTKLETNVPPEHIPAEMKAKLQLLYCHVLFPGEMKQDDDVYIYTCPKRDIFKHISKFFNPISFDRLSRLKMILRIAKKSE